MAATRSAALEVNVAELQYRTRPMGRSGAYSGRKQPRFSNPSLCVTNVNSTTTSPIMHGLLSL